MKKLSRDEEEDLADAAYMRRARAQKCKFRPLREVLAEIDAKKRKQSPRVKKKSGVSVSNKQ